MKTQTGLKIGTQTGSVINWMMSANATLPVVGKGATVLSWTDRHAYEVVEVSEDMNTVIIKACIAKALQCNAYTEDQKWDYSELSQNSETLVWKNNKWMKKIQTIEFDNKYYAEYELAIVSEGISARERMLAPLFSEGGLLMLVEGKTKLKTKYSPVSIIFGHKEEYCDPSF